MNKLEKRLNKIKKHIENYNLELLDIIDDLYKHHIRVDYWTSILLENRIQALNQVLDASRKLEKNINKEIDILRGKDNEN